VSSLQSVEDTRPEPERPGLYNALGRAVSPLHLARPSLCALEALRWVVGGATMTTPGGTRTRYSYNFLRARRTGFSHGSEPPGQQGSGPSLCPAPMPQKVSYVQ
jgi:hypothetical protein